MKKIFTQTAVIITAFFIFVSCCQTKTTEKITPINPTNPTEAIQELKDGNARFVSQTSIFPNIDTQRLAETSEGQAPFVAVVGCSDSRVPVELLFDRGVGDIFVIRTAGNSVSSDMLMGSVDYAVAHLGVKLVVVLGHSKCGGIAGAIKEDDKEHADDHSVADGKVGTMIETLREDVKEHIGTHDLDAAVATNAKAQVAKILEVEYIKAKVEAGELQVVPAIYDIKTGVVTFLE